VTWDEHLAKCKVDAHKLVDRGMLADAVASMASDILKHPDGPKGAVVDTLVVVALLYIVNHDVREIRRWIDGWH